LGGEYVAEFITDIDETIMLFMQEHLRSPILNPVMIFISVLGNYGFIWIVAAVVLMCRKDTRKAGFLSLLAMGLCYLLTNVMLKNLFMRVRPYNQFEEIVPLITRPLDYSFPSGHTASSFAAAGIFGRYLNRKKAVSAGVYAVLMGISRVYIGVHYPTDVLGGMAMGIISSKIIHMAEKRILLIKSEYSGKPN